MTIMERPRCMACGHIYHDSDCGVVGYVSRKPCPCERTVTQAELDALATVRIAEREAQYRLREAHSYGKHRRFKVPECEACGVEMKIALHEWSSRYFPAVGIPRALR